MIGLEKSKNDPEPEQKEALSPGQEVGGVFVATSPLLAACSSAEPLERTATPPERAEEQSEAFTSAGVERVIPLRAVYLRGDCSCTGGLSSCGGATDICATVNSCPGLDTFMPYEDLKKRVEGNHSCIRGNFNEATGICTVNTASRSNGDPLLAGIAIAFQGDFPPLQFVRGWNDMGSLFFKTSNSNGTCGGTSSLQENSTNFRVDRQVFAVQDSDGDGANEIVVLDDKLMMWTLLYSGSNYAVGSGVVRQLGAVNGVPL